MQIINRLAESWTEMAAPLRREFPRAAEIGAGPACVEVQPR
jgi:hypothetical protein